MYNFISENSNIWFYLWVVNSADPDHYGMLLTIWSQSTLETYASIEACNVETMKEWLIEENKPSPEDLHWLVKWKFSNINKTSIVKIWISVSI